MLDKNKKYLTRTHGKDFFNTFLKSDLSFTIEKSVLEENDTLYFSYNNDKVYAHSKYAPFSLAKKFIDGVQPSINSVYILFGIGLSYELINICQYESVSEVIIIERNKEILLEALKRVDLQSLNKNIKIVRTYDEFFYYITNKPENAIKNATQYFNNAYEIVDNDFFKEIQKVYITINANITTNKNTAIRFHKEWFDLAINNFIPFLNSKNPVNFYNNNEGKPAIIVGAGPSLDKNVKLLKELNDEIFIFCTHTAYKVLINEGIVPHAICAIDSNQPIIDEYKKDGFTVPFFTCFHVPTEIFQYAKGDVFFSKNSADGISTKVIEELKIDVKETALGGSVACSMMGILHEAKFSPIILIGMDLAFTDNKTHASGTFYADKTKFDFDFQNGRQMVLGYNGGAVETSLSMKTYIDWFENFIKIKNVDVINATEGGAFIEGAKNMTLKDAINKYRSSINVIKDEPFLFTKEQKGKVYSVLEKYRNALVEIRDNPSIYKFDREEMSILGLKKDYVIYQVNDIAESGKNADNIYIEKMVQTIDESLIQIDRLLLEVKNESNC